jgi:hypothetical protein
MERGCGGDFWINLLLTCLCMSVLFAKLEYTNTGSLYSRPYSCHIYYFQVLDTVCYFQDRYNGGDVYSMKKEGPRLMRRLLLILDKDAGSLGFGSLLELFMKLNYFLNF